MAKLDDTLTEDQALRRWAVAQLVQMHGSAGLTSDELLRQTDLLVGYVKGKDAKHD